ncbi:hypothetical protein BDV34DRAFT_201395, partial [Aspergillus parasiticus]
MLELLKIRSFIVVSCTISSSCYHSLRHDSNKYRLRMFAEQRSDCLAELQADISMVI